MFEPVIITKCTVHKNIFYILLLCRLFSNKANFFNSEIYALKAYHSRILTFLSMILYNCSQPEKSYMTHVHIRASTFS